jgi:hypothetical protein
MEVQSTLSIVPSSAPPSAKRLLRFAISKPSLRDGILVYCIGRLAAWLTATKEAKEYCHCELLFEDDRCFGITTGGMHFVKRSLMLDEYEFFATRIDEKTYLKLEEYCTHAMDESIYSFSSIKAVVRHLFLGKYLTKLWSSKSTYCSELIVLVLHLNGIFQDLRIEEATPNGLASYIIQRMLNYDMYICCGPALPKPVAIDIV